MHLNVRSVRNKICEIEALLNEEATHVDIFCISEHFLYPDEVDSLAIENINRVSYYARDMSYGGSMIMCRTGVRCTGVEAFVEYSCPSTCEVSALDWIDEQLRVITVYRQPKGDFEAFMEIMAGVLTFNLGWNGDTVINGDFNVYFHTRDTRFLALEDLLMSFGFEVTIFEPTHGENCIDNILINFSQSRNSCSHVYDPVLSDHRAVCISINSVRSLSTEKRSHIVRPITAVGKFHFFGLLQQEDWAFVDSVALGIDAKFDRFMEVLVGVLDRAIPRKSVFDREVNSSYLEWFDGDLREQRDHLKFLQELRQCFPEDELIVSTFKHFKVTYKLNLEKAKKAHIGRQIRCSSNKNKAYWDVINKSRKTGVSKPDIDLDPDELNDFFVNVPNLIKSSIPPVDVSFTDYLTDLNSTPTSLFSFKHATYIKVRDIIKGLKNKKSKDYYDLTVDLLKSVVDIIVYPLTKLINQCIDEGVYPDALKISRVIPIFKKGSKTEMNNYRPIALVPVISKVFEVHLQAQITSHFESSDLFFDGQYGFRRSKSTTDVLLRLTDEIVNGMEEGLIVGSYFYDLSKAFDCLTPDKLIRKLQFYGFHNESLALVSSYLTGRRQSTFLNGRVSRCEGVTSGVPQGSILGPTLFLIYINDLYKSVDSGNARLLLFADDTTIVGCSSREEKLNEKLESEQVSLLKWFASNDLSVNVDKTSKVLFTHRDTTSDNAACVRYLGVMLDPVLAWGGHVDHLAGRISRNIYVIRKLVKVVETDVILTAYYSLIEAHMSYGLLLWGHSCHSKRIFGLQRRVVRVMRGLRYRSDAKDAFIKLGILTLPGLYILQCLMLARRINGHVFHGDLHDHETRQREQIYIRYLRLKSSRYSHNYYCKVFYNKLPLAARSLPDKLFKDRMKTWLTDHPYYSLDEFLQDDLPGDIVDPQSRRP